ncbi:hypothetical protein [Chenggangzhangella methanolivorans]|uniref:Uncharacterized protein n=1 Tax=Chenggangzhangella methanolivorans TaxID=1437009 RepID=A0A9E6UKW2_9HYPH|nr:hypothetical protein [Chenggangzhangella methanolivorans]QZN99866.1 hypothetical protein K6K41_25000 [Chenggangzhangella methanolivorans]
MALHHRLACVAAAVVAALSVSAPQARAAFSEFSSLGKDKVLSDVACIAAPKGAVCTAQSIDSKLAVNKYNGSKWSGWDLIGAGVVSKPSCAQATSKLVVCAARHESGGVMVVTYNGKWSKPEIVKGDTSSAPSCAGVGEDSAVCVTRGVDGSLYWLKSDGDKTSGLTKLNGATTVPPRCSPDNRFTATRMAICMYGNTDGHIYARRFDGKGATGALDLAGLTYTEVNCTELGKGTGGRVTCVTKNQFSNLYLTSFAGGPFQTTGWSAYAYIGGSVAGASSCGAIAFNQIGCALVGTDSQLFVYQVVNGTFSGFTAMGGTFVGTPSCFALEIGKVMCAAVGTDGVARSTVGP